MTRTKAALFGAIRDLVRADDSNLSVSTVCERARVSRPAFYQHFTSLDDLLQAAVRDRLEQLQQHAVAPACGAAEAEVPEPRASAMLEAMLTELAGERDLYAGTLGDIAVARRLQSTFEDWLLERLRRARPEVDGTTLSFVCGGVSRVIVDWLGQGPERAGAAELAGALWRLVDAGLGSAQRAAEPPAPGAAAGAAREPRGAVGA